MQTTEKKNLQIFNLDFCDYDDYEQVGKQKRIFFVKLNFLVHIENSRDTPGIFALGFFTQ